MSSQTLSQQEIDLLFSGADAVRAAPAPREQKVDVQLYDFRRPNLISKERLRALEAMYGLMTKSFESWLSARLRGHLELHLEGVEQLSFGEFVLSLPNPCSSYVYEIAEASQQAVIDFGRDFAFAILDRLLGSSAPPFVPDRVLTPLERMIVQIATDRLAQQLCETWQDHVRLTLKLSRFESMPDMLQAANREDPVLVANIVARTSGVESPLLVCLPFALLEKYFTSGGVQRPRLASANSPERARERRLISATMRSVGLQVAARTDAFTATISDLLTLRPGAVLDTGLNAEPAITLLIEGEPRFVGVAGRNDRALAVRIIEEIDGSAATSRAPVSARSTLLTSPGDNMSTAEHEMDMSGVASLSRLRMLTLPVIIELGRTRMSLHEIMELGRGGIVQLDRLVGEPVDVIVGDRNFAEGEVVVLGEQFGVRITRILSQGAVGAEELAV